MTRILTPDEIIDALGGTSAVARECEIQPPSVSEWRKGGIPKSQLKFLRLAHPDVFAKLEANKLREEPDRPRRNPPNADKLMSWTGN